MRRTVVLVGFIAAAVLLPNANPPTPAPAASEQEMAAGSRQPLRPAAETTTSPVIPCATRAEPSVARFESQRDVIRGPFALVTIKRDMPRLSRDSYRLRAGRLPEIKLPVGLRAGHEATLRVHATQRGHAALMYRQTTQHGKRIQDGDRAVTFKPCSPDTPAFSGGTVGPITGWAGALIMTGPRCIRLVLRVDGRRRPDIRLPLGRRCR